MTKHIAGSERTRGFTLIELLAALAVAGLVVLTVHRLFGATIDQSRRLTLARADLDRGENAARWLADAVASIEVGKEEPGPFIGTTSGFEFTTWLRTPYGWHEADRVSVSREDHRLVARRLSGGVIVLADSVAAADFDYLLEWGAAAPWLLTWTSSVNPPLAIRVRVRRFTTAIGAAERADTTLFLVGSRG
jgi:prepilin-type N-terminal cleavage/methylation domain-containing protein